MYKDYKPLKFFGIFAFLFFVFGIIVGIPVIIEFVQTRYITKVPSAVLATGCILFSVIIAQCAVMLDTVAKQHKEIYQLEILRFKQIENLRKK